MRDERIYRNVVDIPGYWHPNGAIVVINYALELAWLVTIGLVIWVTNTPALLLLWIVVIFVGWAGWLTLAHLIHSKHNDRVYAADSERTRQIWQRQLEADQERFQRDMAALRIIWQQPDEAGGHDEH